MPKVHLNPNQRPIDAIDKLTAESRTPGRTSKRGGTPNVKGCSENNNKEHFYSHVLWISSYSDKSKPEEEYHYWGPCIGCGHRRFGNKSKPTGEPDVIYRRIWRKDPITNHYFPTGDTPWRR